MLAEQTYKSRSSKYGNEWETRGWRGSLSDVMRKAGRIRRHIWEAQQGNFDGDIDLDDVYDLINYCAFFIANYENNNEWGTK